MKQPLEINTWWVYIGPGNSGVKHKLIDITAGWATTWSEAVNVEGAAGFSWFGPCHMFTSHFMPLK